MPSWFILLHTFEKRRLHVMKKSTACRRRTQEHHNHSIDYVERNKCFTTIFLLCTTNEKEGNLFQIYYFSVRQFASGLYRIAHQFDERSAAAVTNENYVGFLTRHRASNNHSSSILSFSMSRGYRSFNVQRTWEEVVMLIFGRSLPNKGRVGKGQRTYNNCCLAFNSHLLPSEPFCREIL